VKQKGRNGEDKNVNYFEWLNLCFTGEENANNSSADDTHSLVWNKL
jgi:hypothetical protein